MRIREFVKWICVLLWLVFGAIPMAYLYTFLVSVLQTINSSPRGSDVIASAISIYSFAVIVPAIYNLPDYLMRKRE